jgi:hypothetical protein
MKLKNAQRSGDISALPSLRPDWFSPADTTAPAPTFLKNVAPSSTAEGADR